MKVNDPVIFTDKAKCEDCYRCLRNCPVKAIRIKDGQAFVDEKRCILCGRCIKECPQNAKTVRNDIDRMKKILNSDYKAAVSVAPSYIGLFEKWQIKRFASIFRDMGFDYVAETVVAAADVSKYTIKQYKKNNDKKISTACPVFVNYIQKYHPEYIKNLSNIKSPMIMHGKYLKDKLGEDYKIVFIGTCIAKKKEAEQSSDKEIDVVITFDELKKYFKNNSIKFENFEESNFDENGTKNSGYYPLSGGMYKAAEIEPKKLSENYIALNGEINITDYLKSLDTNCLVEPLFCKQGCIAGPGTFSFDKTIFDRKISVLKNVKNIDALKRNIVDNTKLSSKHFYRYFKNKLVDKDEIPEDKIREVLSRTGKEDKQNQLNCGACGYDSCREKAKAVIKGLAEVQMCIPYMRRLAEKRSDKIIEKSPNGIVILNEKLKIIDINNSFRKMFNCSESVLGKHISYLIDPDPMEKVLISENDVHEKTVSYSKYNLICYQMVYYLHDENQIIGVFIDITSAKKNKKRLQEIKSKAIQQANELIKHQMEVAQQMTNYLGKSTAKGEQLIKKLIEVTKKENKNNDNFSLEDWL